MKSCSTDDQLGSAHGPRTTCGAVLPGTELNRHVPANRRFYGARPRERPRRRTVGPGRTDSSYRSRSIFVIRRRSKRNTNPAVGRAERRWTHASRDRLASPLRTLERGPYARTTRRYPPARGVPPGQAGAGSGDVEPTPRSNSKHVRQSSMTSINTIQTRQKLATFLTPET